MEIRNFEFEITDSGIIITDPCYDPDSDCNFYTEIDSGVWNGTVLYYNDRPKEIFVYNDSNFNIKTDIKWNKITGDICVDSGLVGFYDFYYFQDDDVIKDLNSYYDDDIEKTFPEQKWFSANYGVTKTQSKAGNIPFGFVVETPYMNGCYDLYHIKQDGFDVFKLVLFE